MFQPTSAQQGNRPSWWQTIRAALTPDFSAWQSVIHQTPKISRQAWWLSLAGLWLAQLVLLAVTWGGWPDLIIDFGRELYVPWQLSEGATLYRDVAYFNGPLSPTINATIFGFLGASFSTLAFANSAVLSLVVLLLFKQLTRHFSLRVSIACTAIFLMIFAYGHTYGIGNFNFISPYSHEMSHGCLLSLLLLELVSGNRSSPLRCMLAGGVWGLLFLGKPELFVAGGLMLAASMVMRHRLFDRHNVKSSGNLSGVSQISCVALGLAAVLLPAIALLARHQGDWTTCVVDACGAWPWLLGSNVSHLYFYQSISGMDTPIWNAAMALGNLTGFVLLLVMLRLMTTGGRIRRELKWVGIAVGCGLLLMGPRLILKDFFVGGCIMVIAAVYGATRFRDQQGDKYLHLVCWSVWGVALLQKMFLYPRVDGYGFVLAAPIVILGTAVVISWLPRLYFSGRHQVLVTAGIVGLIAVDATVMFAISQERMRSKEHAVARLAEGIRTYQCIGPIAEEAIDYIHRNTTPLDQVLVLPEGVMFNYLTRRSTPTAYYNFMPPEMAMFGEARILNQIQARPPEFVVLVRRVLDEYGLDRFGCDGYGDLILNWVNQNYDPVRSIGADPLHGEDFGIQILAKRRLNRVASDPSDPQVILPTTLTAGALGSQADRD